MAVRYKPVRSSLPCHKPGVPLRTKHSDIKRTLRPLGERLQRLDEEAAEVVRHIFSLTLEGYGPYNSYIKDQRHSKFLVFRMMMNC